MTWCHNNIKCRYVQTNLNLLCDDGHAFHLEDARFTVYEDE